MYDIMRYERSLYVPPSVDILVLVECVVNSLNAKCIYTCMYTKRDYLPHHSCSAMRYIVLIKITLNMHASAIRTCI